MAQLRHGMLLVFGAQSRLPSLAGAGTAGPFHYETSSGSNPATQQSLSSPREFVAAGAGRAHRFHQGCDSSRRSRARVRPVQGARVIVTSLR